MSIETKHYEVKDYVHKGISVVVEIDYDERAEAAKCVRCNHSVGYSEPGIKKISYKRNSQRPYRGKK